MSMNLTIRHDRVRLTNLRLAWGLLLTKYHEPGQLQLHMNEQGNPPVWSCKRTGEAHGYGKWTILNLGCSVEETIESWLHRLQTVLGIPSKDEVIGASPQRCSSEWWAELEEIVYDDVRWNGHLHKNISIERFKSHVASLEEALLHKQNQLLRDVPMLLADEYTQLVRDFNQTTLAFPREKTIHGLFSERAASHSGRIAIVSNAGNLSYGELERDSSRLAASLRKRGVGKGQMVAITADRTPEMLIGLLAILKTGAAYIPIDHRSPEAHNRIILEDCGAQIAISRMRLPGLQTLNPYEDSSYSEESELEMSALMSNDSELLAYVIYTSGTTGAPKGVRIRHRSVINYAAWFNAQYGSEEPLRVLLSANLTFDASVESIFCTLLGGGSVVLIQTELLTHQRAFRQFIDKHQVQVIHLVPTLLNRLLLEGERLASVQIVISGGEVLEQGLKDRLLHKGYRVYNHYGPTEATVVSVTAEMQVGLPVTIGKPIGNTSVYIVNSHMQLCPIGVIGEICIAGEGLAMGYLQREELTKQRFVPNPFESGAMLYRTGDFGKWLPEGLVEYVGRVDEQLKINGILVHPETIRTAVEAHPAIQAAVVIFSPDDEGGKLIVYYRLEQMGAITVSVTELRGFLLQLLPPSIIPKQFVEMQDFPLNFNGKVDKKRLLAMQQESV
ncbi:amino acid adenylation domain-containing protein [Paenibacillus algorifonticola]|uniref:amino acid adenylation domain-containing protein n=1 Tax=Paenibacillus algorifonticola TaxID=684063 RepID=UPI003D29FBE7